MPSLTQIISVPGFCNMETSWYDFSDVCSSILWFCLFYLIIFCRFCLYWIIIAIFFSFSNQIFSLLNQIIAFHNFLSNVFRILISDGFCSFCWPRSCIVPKKSCSFKPLRRRCVLIWRDPCEAASAGFILDGTYLDWLTLLPYVSAVFD